MSAPRALVEPLEARIAPATLLALTEDNRLLRFDSATPGIIDAIVPITGLGPGETLVAFDFSPHTGFLYGLSTDQDHQGRIYRINGGTGAAVLEDTLRPSQGDPYTHLAGDHFSFNFRFGSHPAAQITSDAGLNLSLWTPGYGGLVDTFQPPHYRAAEGGAIIALSGAAAAFPGDGMYGIDTATDRLVLATRNNDVVAGNFTTISSLGVDASGHVGMDLHRPDQTLYTSFVAGGFTGLYKFTSGGTPAILVGQIGDGTTPLRDIAFAEYFWSGAGGNELWSNGQNWNSGVAPGPDADLTFRVPEGQTLTTRNDLPSSIRIASAHFAGKHVVTGNVLTIRNTITIENSVWLDLPIQLSPELPTAPWDNSTVEVYLAPGNANLVFTDTLDLNGSPLLVFGDGIVAFRGDITGTGNLQLGAVRHEIEGTKSFVGDVRVVRGSLALTGDHSSRTVHIENDGQLYSSSSLGLVASSFKGKLAPGGPWVGVVHAEDLHLATDSILEFNIGLWWGVDALHDRIVASGSVSLAGILHISDSPLPDGVNELMIVDNQGTEPIAQGFAGVAEGEILQAGFYRYRISYQGGDGNDVVLTRLLDPVISRNGKTATFTDVDGDRVQVRVSTGRLHADDFVFVAAPNFEGAGHLLSIDLRGSDRYRDLTIVATRQDANGDGHLDGDGFVNVGTIEAIGRGLRNVSIDGALGSINVGYDIDKPALARLSVRSLGGLDAFETNFTSLVLGHIGEVFIAGNMEGGRLHVEGNIGQLTIGGSVHGGSETNSGSISAVAIRSLDIHGNVIGGSGEGSGSLITGGGTHHFSLKGSIIGGDGLYSGSVSTGFARKVVLLGDIIGGNGDGSGALDLGGVRELTIGGGIYGGGGSNSGVVSLVESMVVARIAAGVIGGPGESSGIIFSDPGFELLHIGASVLGGTVVAGGELRNLVVDGSLAGTELDPAIISAAKIGTITVNRDARFATIASETRINRVAIAQSASHLEVFASGLANPNSSSAAVTIGSVAIGGSFTDSSLIAGYSYRDAVYSNPDTSIGSVRINGDFIRSDITAGISPGPDGAFGTADDVVIANGGSPEIFAKIAAVTITGRVSGGSNTAEHYAITAERLRSITFDDFALLLTPEPDHLIFGAPQNLHIRELAPTIQG